MKRDFSRLEKNQKVSEQGFTFSERTLEKGCIIPPHWHDYCEIEILLSGKLHHTLNKDSRIITGGTLYFLTPLDSHSISVSERADIINIAFTEGFAAPKASALLSRSSEHTLTFNESEFRYIVSRAECLSSEQEGLPFSNEIAAAVISELIYLILRKTSANTESAPHPSVIQNAVNILMKSYSENLSTASVADRIHVTPQYLGKLFKKSMGVSLTDYLNNLRLKHACSMLVHTDAAIKEVAYESGYNSVEYFLYVFKTNIHTTPTQYRLQNSK